MKKCMGCGIELQSNNLKGNGYLPATVLDSGEKELFCQRCFKIKNYNQYIPIEMSKEDYKNEVKQSIEKSDVAVAIFDIINFESSFDDEILDILRDMNSIVVINKVDLVPDDKHPSEISNWVKERLAEEGIAPLDIAIVSSKNSYGINGILKKIKHFYPNGGTALIVGVTNVGKSSIVNKLIGSKKVTVSKFPGTTLKSLQIKIPNTNIEIIDTPGLIPNGRFSDFVCEECNQKIIPSNEISRRTYKLQKDRIVLIGGMVQIKILNEDEFKPIFSIYASRDVKFHETNIEKSKELLIKSDFLSIPCEKCNEKFNSLEKERKVYTIETGDELVFKGLGWIAVKRGPLKIEITYPKGGDIVIRDGFIKPRRQK